MPVAQSRGHAGKALLIAGVSVLLLLVVTWLVAQAANRGDVDIKLGDDRFDAGRVEGMAESIDEGDGLPFLFPDLVNEGRDLFVQHEGDDPDVGWSAFGAFDPDRPECRVEIDREEQVLVNACDRDVSYPPDGTGLRFYPTRVEDGRLIVDINEITTSTASG
ncbi:MAG: hypothetical protein Q8K58_03975 [Acidimicrobiales bacterium]|nr:hypothetical protein [Acidimicrobiales bacterium]